MKEEMQKDELYREAIRGNELNYEITAAFRRGHNLKGRKIDEGQLYKFLHKFFDNVLSLLNSDKNPEVSDTTTDDSSNSACSIKQFKEALEKAEEVIKRLDTDIIFYNSQAEYLSARQASFAKQKIAEYKKHLLPIIERLQMEKEMLAAQSIGRREAMEKLQGENKHLRLWKESAMVVMPDFQEIGKLLNIPLGESVHDKIIPGIKKLLEEKLRGEDIKQQNQ